MTREAKFIEYMPGVIVERDVLNIVQKIKEYDDNLDVQYLDPAKGADLYEAPYRIVERCKDGFTRVVFAVWKLDETVLERIYAADTAKVDVLARLDANNMAIRTEQNQRFKEQVMGEALDISKHVLRNPKTSYTFPNAEGEVIKVEDDKGRIK